MWRGRPARDPRGGFARRSQTDLLQNLWMEKGIPYIQREKEKEKYRMADGNN